GVGGKERQVDGQFGGQEPAKMAEVQNDDPVVEQVRAEAQFPRAQQLGGVALPGIGLPVEADQTAKEQNRETDIRIDTKEKRVDVMCRQHVTVSLSMHRRHREARGIGDRPARVPPAGGSPPNAGCSNQSLSEFSSRSTARGTAAGSTAPSPPITSNACRTAA